MADDAVDLNNNSVYEDGADFDLSMDNDFFKVSGARRFSYEDLVGATNDFSETEQLGKGGFGSVYRGFSKELNCYVAVKRVSGDSKQGIKEYASEVKIISQLRHRNIVQLIGWCHQRKELLLVYEFMANGSLDSHLFKENRLLPWEIRFKIAQGLAWGLLYLHDQWAQYVVHRDIKASNIMLDSNFEAKIGDFGLARLGDHGKVLENTTLAGTIGYISPEYATSGRASKESDVYSFGVVVLEIACGRKVMDRKAIREDRMNLREWVWNCHGRGNILEAADPRLNGEFDKQQMKCLMIVGLWCAHPNAKSRPVIEKAMHVLNSVAPLPHLPPKMPFATYVTSISMSSSAGNDLVPTEEKKLPERSFGSIYKGLLNFGLWKRSKEKKEEAHFGTRMFSYRDLARATNNFSEQMRLGHSNFQGYSKAYKGFLQESNSFVTVNCLSNDRAIDKEVYATISRLRHKNLQQFIGLCHSKSTVFLVYEFMPDCSLDLYLFREGSLLAWKVRYKIAQDLASGLHYFHEECELYLVHGYVNPSNIMLEPNFNAKLGGFGLPMLMDSTQAFLSTTNRIHEWECMAPEFFISGKATKECDVYGFGIVALEISCGRKLIDHKASDDQICMLDWVWDMYGKGKLLQAADARLNGDFDEKEMEVLMVIGLWCAHPDAKSRPSVKQVIQVLNFEAPLPNLPPEMPMAAYLIRASTSGIDLNESQNQFSGSIDITDIAELLDR